VLLILLLLLLLLLPLPTTTTTNNSNTNKNNNNNNKVAVVVAIIVIIVGLSSASMFASGGDSSSVASQLQGGMVQVTGNSGVFAAMKTFIFDVHRESASATLRSR
jgi:hypothetical protein